MTRKEYNRLYQKYISGKCTDEECKILETYQDTFEFGDKDWDKESMGDSNLIRQSIFNELTSSLDKQNKRRVIPFRWLYAAASIVLTILSVALYTGTFNKQKIALKSEAPHFTDDILPGNNKAVLTLDDGSLINLDDAKNGLLAKESNTAIEKLPGGQLHYTAGTHQPGTGVKYNSVTTPRGGQFQITLPDGSKVWLNAGSSLRFPTLFTGMERRVELKGEAYFEIAKNALMPFKVIANNSEIKVLGTHFNVMAYEDEKDMNTTLLEGSVEILKGPDNIRIKPGQSAILNKSTGTMNVAIVDPEQAVAWKNGYFIFDDENIESIMRKVSRWYNVEILYKGNMKNKDFTGIISRNEKVSELLKMLELTGAIHFSIAAGDASGEERRITVMP